MKLTKKDTFNIILIIASVLLVAGLGSLFVNLGMEWYSNLNTPSQWIPNIVIPIVWTIIYILFAIVFSLLYKEAFVDKKNVNPQHNKWSFKCFMVFGLFYTKSIAARKHFNNIKRVFRNLFSN